MSDRTGPGEDVRVGRLLRDGRVVGFMAIDRQDWTFVRREGWRRRRWTETRTRYRLDLLDDGDEGFLDAADEDGLDAGRFVYRGETLAYVELVEPERRRTLDEHFTDWA